MALQGPLSGTAAIIVATGSASDDSHCRAWSARGSRDRFGSPDSEWFEIGVSGVTPVHVDLGGGDPRSVAPAVLPRRRGRRPDVRGPSRRRDRARAGAVRRGGPSGTPLARRVPPQ